MFSLLSLSERTFLCLKSDPARNAKHKVTLGTWCCSVCITSYQNNAWPWGLCCIFAKADKSFGIPEEREHMKNRKCESQAENKLFFLAFVWIPTGLENVHQVKCPCRTGTEAVHKVSPGIPWDKYRMKQWLWSKGADIPCKTFHRTLYIPKER